MNIESKTVTINKPAKEVFEYLSKVENFKTLMPENISKFEVIDTNSFTFALKGMPEIALKKQEETPTSKIVLSANGGKINFSLTGNINEIDSNTSSVKLNFEGDFNPMMAMMIKGPITKFLETLSNNLTEAVK